MNIARRIKIIYNRNTLHRFLFILRPHWYKLTMALIFMLVSIGLQLPMPFLTKYLIDNVIKNQSFKLLNLIGLVLVGVLLIKAYTYYLQNLLMTTFRGRVMYDIRMKLFSHIQKTSLAFIQSKQTGYLMSRLSDDVDAVQGLLADTVVSGVQNILIFIVGIICIIYIHSKLAIICISILPVYFISLVLFNKRVKEQSHEVREQFAFVQKELQELLSGIYLIKTFAAERRAILQMSKKLKCAVRKAVKLDILTATAMICSSVLSAFGPLALIWVGCGEIIKGHLTVGGLLAFSSFIGYLFGPTKSLYDLTLGVQRSLASVERIFEILDVKTEVDGNKPISIQKGQIKFEGVTFYYDKVNPVLKNLSFEIKQGEKVALTGRSGVGKTTIVNLLLKLFFPISGNILIDEQNIDDVWGESLRSQIGVVSQDTILFSCNIYENILYGNPKASDEEIQKAAIIANAHEFILEFPEGYKTIVGERGAKLSGGQKQRIALARVILKNPRIIILDEATSQVDVESEGFIQDTLKVFLKDKTTLIIAHRLSTIKHADRTIVLEDGRIVSEGTHGDLYKNCKTFKHMCNEQLISQL